MSKQKANVLNKSQEPLNYADDRIIVKYKAPSITGSTDIFNLKMDYVLNGIKIKSSRIINPSPRNEAVMAISIANRSNQDRLEMVELEEIGSEAVERAIKHFASMDNVEYAEKCFKLKFSNAQSQPPAAADWCCSYGLQKICAPQAWEISQGDSDIVVGVIDTGLDIRHPSIRNSLWVNPNPGMLGYEGDVHGYDFVHGLGYSARSIATDDPTGHGTHIAGIIAASAFGACTVTGVAPNVKIAVIKVSHLDEGDTSTAIEGINYANNMGIPITNNSYFGLPGESRAFRETIEGGGLFVACAGNEHTDIDEIPTYPASFNCENSIVVAATDHNDELMEFSNYGAKSVHIAAPGYNICSLLPYSGVALVPPAPDYLFRYVTMSGTSMATPYVAGAAALVLSALKASGKFSDGASDKETLKPLIMEVKKRILENADFLHSLEGKVNTCGRLNAYKAIK